ncbi:hypothetical protein Tco_1469294 [Tanacetum coccineum]
MKEIFKELEAEVDQNVMNRKYDEIKRKNLLITNDNLIANCLSKEVFYIAINSELTISRFTKMHDAHTVVQARCLELEAELSKLHDKVQKDDHTELVKHFSNLEIYHLNLQLKYQNLKESFGNNTSPPTRDALDFDSVFIMRAKHIEQTTALLTENENLKAHIHENLKCITMESIKPRVLTPGVNSYTDASRSQSRSNTKNNRILPAKSVNKKKVEEHPRTNMSSLKTMNHVDSSISSKSTVINSNSHSVCQTCNKCLIFTNHDVCVVNYLHYVNASPSVKNVVRKVKQVWKPKQVKQVWKATGPVLTSVGYQWRPTGRIFTLGEQ